MNKILKVGIAGYGVVGKRRRICVDKHPNLKLVAVCDKSFGVDYEQHDSIKYFSSYQELLSEKLDLVFVCLTNDIAAEVTLASLKSGAHTFCEKPPARNLLEMLDVIRYLKANPQLKIMYGFNHRYHYSVLEAIKTVQSGCMGKVINIRGVYGKSKLITFNQSDWRTNRDIAGGGVLLDQGIHMVDLMRLFAGEFSKIHAIIRNSHWGYDVEDNAYALMESDDGIVGMLCSSATEWRHSFNLEITLQLGSIKLSGLLTDSKSYGDEVLRILYANHENCGDPKEVITHYPKDDSWYLEVSDFVAHILSDKPIIGGSMEDAFETMNLVYKIYSADNKWAEKYLIENPRNLTYESIR